VLLGIAELDVAATLVERVLLGIAELDAAALLVEMALSTQPTS